MTTDEGRDRSAEESRRQAVAGWPLIESNRDRDAIQRWVRHGDASQVSEPHASLIRAWRTRSTTWLPFPCCDHCGCGTAWGVWPERTGHDDTCAKGCNDDSTDDARSQS